MNKYPENERLYEIREESQKIGFFLEWLKNRYELCKFYSWQDLKKEGDESPEGYYPDRKSIENILAEYFQIDMKKVNEEREQILKDIRDMNKI